jgi:replication-associated recombination protein RarA
VAQEYLPDVLKGATFYQPGSLGFEKTVAERIAWWRRRAGTVPATDEGGGPG